MIRPALLATALLALSAAPAQAYTDLTYQQFLQHTGSTCLLGGAVVGLTAFMTGPAALAAVVTTAAIPTTTATTSVFTLLGCGVGAGANLVYASAYWIYDMFFTDPRYPLLYPSRAQLAEEAAAQH